MMTRPGPVTWLRTEVERTGHYSGKLRDIAVTVIWLAAGHEGYCVTRSEVQGVYDATYPEVTV